MAAHTGNFDVVVVGGGNAAFCAAHAAAGRGRKVLLLEKGTRQFGGNSYYTAGATRIAHAGLDDLLDFVEPTSATAGPRFRRTPPTTTPATSKVTEGRNDHEFTAVLVTERSHGALAAATRAELPADVRAPGLRDRRVYLFWGGLHVGTPAAARA